MEIDLKIRENGKVKIIDIIGGLNTNTSSSVDEELNKIISEGYIYILVNGEKLDFIASSGLRVIMAASNKLRSAKGEIKLCELNSTVKNVFIMSSLEKIFGIFDTEDEAIAIANDTEYGLTNYIQTSDPERARRVARELRSGMVDINGKPRASGSPFGGMKQSGNGREGGAWGLEEFTEVRAIGGWPIED